LNRQTATTPNGERVSLRDYVDSQFEAIEKQREAYEKSLDARLESMNQFRNQITDQARTFVTKVEYDANHRYLESDVKECVAFNGRMRGMATQNQVLIAYALAVLGMIIGFVGHFLK
jgi:hypothetical protein